MLSTHELITEIYEMSRKLGAITNGCSFQIFAEQWQDLSDVDLYCVHGELTSKITNLPENQR